MKTGVKFVGKLPLWAVDWVCSSQRSDAWPERETFLRIVLASALRDPEAFQISTVYSAQGYQFGPSSALSWRRQLERLGIVKKIRQWHRKPGEWVPPIYCAGEAIQKWINTKGFNK